MEIFMNKSRNPFIDDSVITKQDYCPRTQIEEKIYKKDKVYEMICLDFCPLFL